MAISDAAICNRALGRIGQSGNLASLAESNEAARACNVVFPQARAELLQAFAWPFALRRANLVEVGEETHDGWAFTYALPSDCLFARRIWSGARDPILAERVEFAIEHDATRGRILLCDLEATADDPVVLSYTAEITNPILFPPLFVDALAWLVAQELAMWLKVDPALGRMAGEKYELARQRAAAVALNEAARPAAPMSPSIAVRGIR